YSEAILFFNCLKFSGALTEDLGGTIAKEAAQKATHTARCINLFIFFLDCFGAQDIFIIFLKQHRRYLNKRIYFYYYHRHIIMLAGFANELFNFCCNSCKKL